MAWNHYHKLKLNVRTQSNWNGTKWNNGTENCVRQKILSSRKDFLYIAYITRKSERFRFRRKIQIQIYIYIYIYLYIYYIYIYIYYWSGSLIEFIWLCPSLRLPVWTPWTLGTRKLTSFIQIIVTPSLIQVQSQKKFCPLVQFVH